MKRLHIVHIIGTLSSGGVQTNLFNIIKTDPLNSFEHSVICVISDTGNMRQKIEGNARSIECCPLRWPPGNFTPSYQIDQFLRDNFYFTFPWRLSSLLKKINADLVHTHVTLKVGLQASAVLDYANLPWIWTLHGLYRSVGGDVSEWAKTVRLVNKKNAAVTGVSKSALNELTSYEYLPPEKQKIIYNGVDLKSFSNGELKNRNLREVLGISKTSLVFGTAGRLVQLKRHDLLIQAAAIVLQNGLDAHFVIAGDGPLYDQLVVLTKKLGISERLHLLGHQKNIIDVYSMLDVFVLPSDSESFGLSLIEACAAGLPCIATAVGGIPEILGDENGLLISSGSLEELVNAIQRMASIEIRNIYMKRSKIIARKFSHLETARQYAQLYRQLIAANAQHEKRHGC